MNYSTHDPEPKVPQPRPAPRNSLSRAEIYIVIPTIAFFVIIFGVYFGNLMALDHVVSVIQEQFSNVWSDNFGDSYYE